MAEIEFSELLTQLKEVADVVNSFSSEAVQLQVSAALLATLVGAPSNDEAESSPATPEDKASLKNSNSRRRRPQRRSAPTNSSGQNNFDPLAMANSIKQDPNFEIIKKKLIVENASRSNRVRLVSWFAKDEPLTSGSIQRVLQHLGVKMDPSVASRALSDVKDEYIKSEDGPQPTYTLTARGAEAFGKWLLGGE